MAFRKKARSTYRAPARRTATRRAPARRKSAVSHRRTVGSQTLRIVIEQPGANPSVSRPTGLVEKPPRAGRSKF